jgi:hypothetical protein
MVLEAAGLALIASLSPTALLIAGVFLGSAQPRVAAMFYLLGALVMSAAMGLVLLLILRGADLNRSAEHSPRYGFRLGLGILLLVGAFVVAMRKPKDSGSQEGLVSRMAAKPSPVSAFLVGILVFAPGAAFLAALQVIATAKASLDLTVVAIAIVVVINVLFVWLPLLLFLAAPAVTSRYLTAFNGWLRANGRAVLTSVLVVVGLIMVGNGIYGLA